MPLLSLTRQEVESLRNANHLLQVTGASSSNGNKERVTIQWLQQSVNELRKQLVELQEIASKAMKDVTTRTQSWEDLTTIRSDFQDVKLELAAIKERQQKNDIYMQELREESLQQEEELRHFIVQQQNHADDKQQQSSEVKVSYMRMEPRDAAENSNENIELQKVSSVTFM